MTAHHTVLVTGATGTTGSRVVTRLAADGHTAVAASRRASLPPGTARAVRFDWYDPAGHGAALHSADRAYLVPPVGDPDPAAVMLPFLRQARAAGVRRVVLLGSSAIPAGVPGVGQVHAALPGLFDEWAVLQPSWFMQNFTGDHLHAKSIRSEGVIRTATATGRIGFVDAGDIAAVAARLLTHASAPPATGLVLTGPQTLSHDEVAALFTEATGRPVRHLSLTPAQLRDRLATALPEAFADLLTELDGAIAAGAEDRVTDTVERITGRPPRALRDVVQEWASSPSAAASDHPLRAG